MVYSRIDTLGLAGRLGRGNMDRPAWSLGRLLSALAFSLLPSVSDSDTPMLTAAFSVEASLMLQSYSLLSGRPP